MILRRRIVGGLWPFGLVLPWYLYTVNLSNMKFGGSDPTFSKEFTRCNYIIKHYTIGCCGLCGQKVKVWVDKCIVMGAPKFDQDMADRDAQADSANPNELSQRFANQSASGAQTMSVQVLPGLQGGMYMQVQTPNGLMQVQIPRGLQPGMAFHIQVPQPTAVELTGVSLTSRNEGDLERGGGAPAAEGSVVQPQGTPRARPQSASTSREGRNVAAARRRQEAARARANAVVPPPLPPGYGTEELHSEEEEEEGEARERGERASGAGRSGGVPGLGGLAELRDLADMLSSDEEVEDAPPNPSPSPNPSPNPNPNPNPNPSP